MELYYYIYTILHYFKNILMPKNVVVKVSDDTKKELKIKAIKEGKTVQSILSKMIDSYLKTDPPKTK